jgi:hypothetical protein
MKAQRLQVLLRFNGFVPREMGIPQVLGERHIIIRSKYEVESRIVLTGSRVLSGAENQAMRFLMLLGTKSFNRKPAATHAPATYADCTRY